MGRGATNLRKLLAFLTPSFKMPEDGSECGERKTESEVGERLKRQHEAGIGWKKGGRWKAFYLFLFFLTLSHWSTRCRAQGVRTVDSAVNPSVMIWAQRGHSLTVAELDKAIWEYGPVFTFYWTLFNCSLIATFLKKNKYLPFFQEG